VRKIIHIDMDAFFASVEQLDDPSLRGKPVAVGGSKERGVIAAASYEARIFGVRSAMSSSQGAKLCKDLIFVKPRFKRYKEVSRQIREIFLRYTDLIEPLSLDEAFLDVTENKIGVASATFIAQAIRNDIQTELSLTASAGVSYNKFLAKLASDVDKPNGLYVIEPEKAIEFLDALPVERFFGVGKVMASRMHELQIFKGKHLRGLSMDELKQYFGPSADYLFSISRGIDNRSVNPERERKSIAVENTFSTDIFDKANFQLEADHIFEQLWTRFQGTGLLPKTLSIKVKYADFAQVTRSRTEETGIRSKETASEIKNELILQLIEMEKPIRLIGFQFSNFIDGEFQQLHLEL